MYPRCGEWHSEMGGGDLELAIVNGQPRPWNSTFPSSGFSTLISSSSQLRLAKSYWRDSQAIKCLMTQDFTRQADSKGYCTGKITVKQAALVPPRRTSLSTGEEKAWLWLLSHRASLGSRSGSWECGPWVCVLLTYRSTDLISKDASDWKYIPLALHTSRVLCRDPFMRNIGDQTSSKLEWSFLVMLWGLLSQPWAGLNRKPSAEQDTAGRTEEV